jgi:plastocyanin
MCLPSIANAATPDLSWHNHFEAQQKLSNLASAQVVITTTECSFDCFQPCLTIIPGGTVTWVNFDYNVHMITNGNPDNKPAGLFSGVVEPGQKFSYFFDRMGAYPYFDNLHPWMMGVVIVGALDSDYVHEQKLFFSSYC